MAADVLAASAGAPAAVALVTAEGVLTYGALDEAVSGLAEELARRGVGPGALHAVTVEPDRAGVTELLAAWRAGAAVAPLHPRLSEAEREEALATLAVAPSGAQAVVWTSGTGGRRRGVALSHESFVASTLAAARRLGLGGDDVWLASLSPAHVGGLALVVRSVLLGGVLVAPGAFRADLASALLDGEGLAGVDAPPVTHASLVPTQLVHLMRVRRNAPPPGSFRCALVGGAHAPAEVVAQALRAGWPLALTYGATEMCSQVATAPPPLTRLKPGTVGAPLDGVEVRITGAGEILVRGRTQALGYVPASVSTDDPGGALAPLADAEGWYHTGDVGRLDEDGHLWVAGRAADRIVSGGVTVDAVEVEEVLRGHPSVLDACVVGLADVEWGQVVAAWIDAVVGEWDEEELTRHVREALSPAKRPRIWYLGGPLPRNANGKVDRGAVLRALGG